MGQQMSIRRNRRRLHKLIRSQSCAKENSTLSHTFAIHDDETLNRLININTADENELLKVHDIDLNLSKNILKHRRTIGYFHKVEDLVIVPGVGAERLKRIQPQVCVSSKKATRSVSYDSLKSIESRTTANRFRKPVSVNKATIFELQSIPGITQEIAAAIICYRMKKGPYKKLEDLRKVKCIDRIRFNNISRYLTINDLEIASAPEQSYLEKTPNNLCTKINGISLRQSNSNGIINKIPDSIVSDIFELLSAYSSRPFVKELFNYTRNGKASYRVASWNLEGFTQEKAHNLGVKEVLCRTILENGWSILAIQDVSNDAALKLICQELNNPELPRVREWKTNSRSWKYIKVNMEVKNLAFIYDTDGGSGVELMSTEKGPPELNEFCDCVVSSFEIANEKVQILNLMIKSNRSLPGVQEYLEMLLNSSNNYLICCDFCNSSDINDFPCDIVNAKFILPETTSNSLLPKSNNSMSIPNFIINETQHHQFTGFYGIVRHGLSHLAIPSGWSWGGTVSSYYPIWSEFYVHSELNL